MTDKDKIKIAFSRAAATYDAHSGLQREVAAGLARRIMAYMGNGEHALSSTARGGCPGPPVCVKTLLDVGCGTGGVLEAVRRALPETRIHGCDISFAMLDKARVKLGPIALIASDCEALCFADSSFDIIASSLTYQWSGDLKASIREAERTLKPGGLFAFSTLGPATLHELYECYSSLCEYQRPVEFKGADEIEGLIKNAGLEAVSIEDIRIVKIYPRLTELIRTLKNIGASPNRNTGGKGLSKGALLKEAGRIYRERRPDPEGTGIQATYDVIYAAARKRE